MSSRQFGLPSALLLWITRLNQRFGARRLSDLSRFGLLRRSQKAQICIVQQQISSPRSVRRLATCLNVTALQLGIPVLFSGLAWTRTSNACRTRSTRIQHLLIRRHDRGISTIYNLALSIDPPAHQQAVSGCGPLPVFPPPSWPSYNPLLSLIPNRGVWYSSCRACIRSFFIPS